MALAVVEGQADHPVTFLHRQCGCCGGIQSAGEQGDYGALSHRVIQDPRSCLWLGEFVQSAVVEVVEVTPLRLLEQ